VRLGVAFGSGGARGWAHIGVLHALEAAKIRPDIVVGTSIGAVIGALYLVGALTDFTHYTRRLNRLRLSQFFDFKGDARIETLTRAFGCIATDLATGDEIWLQDGPILEALRASYAIPGFFPPVERRGRWLVDGALCNPVPVSLARALGADLVVAVDVNAGLLETASFESDQVGLAESRGPSQRFVRGYFGRRKGGPSTFGVLARSLQIAQTRLSRIRLAEDPPAFVLRPEVGRIGPLEFYRAGECIEAGEEAVRRALPALSEAMRRPRAGAH
jgi:NTE family protein